MMQTDCVDKNVNKAKKNNNSMSIEVAIMHNLSDLFSSLCA